MSWIMPIVAFVLLVFIIGVAVTLPLYRLETIIVLVGLTISFVIMLAGSYQDIFLRLIWEKSWWQKVKEKIRGR